jgi:hypothetical protein
MVYWQTKLATFQSIGFAPVAETEPRKIEAACESRHETTASPTKAGGFDDAVGSSEALHSRR